MITSPGPRTANTATQPEKRFNLVGWIDGEAGKHLADRRRKLGAVARAGRGNDEAGIRPTIDDEFFAFVGSLVCRQSVEADVALDDGACSARDELGQGFADR
jgi:hypothetical protein